ncbi:replicative DNA helicase [Aneurinibacillus sp. Ricciae_BoGa-3]|uniref:replicative DNA helicase n=1 Tax=Aneurinibacillus sp. Ricciae_BoGa-3 TaxID=3022697 RepID=UPI00233FD7AF|nr:replicative DNA helicase [Aneurinibacillus sp. Ricciae_BoGa-3]WCK55403.1 replicative DNA helicase [Aneurinibacillus sp. Ricciae_BoGa-3]
MSEVEYSIPADVQLEEELLASMIFEPETIGEVAGVLQPEQFYSVPNRKLYQEVIERWEQNAESINLVKLVPIFEQLDISASHITDVAGSIASFWEIKQRAERIQQLATLRNAMRAGNQLIANARNWQAMDQSDIQKVVVDAQASLEKIGDSNVRNTMHKVRDVVMDYVERIGDRLDNPDPVNVMAGIPTGLADLDKLLGGCSPTELIILAARPSMGKTALMNQFVLNMAGRRPGAIPIFSLEMSAEKLVARMINNLGNLSNLEGREITEQDYLKLTMAAADLAERNILIDDEPGQTVAKIKAKARRVQQEHGLAAIFIDYLQFIESPVRGMTRAEAVSTNTKALKNMAKEFGVPVVALAQVGRQVEQRQDKRPMMSDLRESGEIEQTADKIMFLYRDDYYDKSSEKKNIVELDLAKNRDGQTGKVELAFLKEYGKFLDLEVHHAEQMACL